MDAVRSLVYTQSLTYSYAVPLIVVFTKYDNLVTEKIIDSNVESLGEEEAWVFGEEKAKEAFKELCVGPLMKSIGKVPVMAVSSGYRNSSVLMAQVPIHPYVLIAQERFKDRIARLIDVTDKEVQRHMSSVAHSNPASLTWAVAQRGSSDLNVGASVEYVLILNGMFLRALLTWVNFT